MRLRAGKGSRAAGLRRLLLLAGAFVLAPAAVAAPPWSEIEALERAGKLEEALSRLPAADGEGFEVAAARHRLLQNLVRYHEAIEEGRRWLERADRIGDAQERIEARRQLARSHASLAEHEAAVALLREAVRMAESLRDARLEIDLLMDLAFSVLARSDYVECGALLRRAETLWAPIADDRLAARIWNVWGSLHQHQGDPLRAIDFGERALAAAERVDDRALLTGTLNNLARASMQIHDYARALVLLERVLGHGPPPRTRVIATINFGICQIELGQVAEAEATLLEARRLALESGLATLEAFATGELGLVAWKRRDAEAALAHFEHAAAVYRGARDATNEAVWRRNMGLVRRDQERFAEALAHYRAADALELSAPGSRPRPNARKHLGQCLAGLGRLREAEALFDEALAGATAERDSKVVWETQRERARLFRRIGRTAEAMAAYEGALAGIESIRGSLQLETFKADFFEDKLAVYAEVVDFVLAEGGADAPRHAFELTERARARAFLDSLVETRTRAEDLVPEPVARREREILGDISSLQARLRRDGTNERATAELAARERDLQTFHLEVRRSHPRLVGLRFAEPVRLDALQRALPEGALLLAYFLAEPESHLWLVRRDRVESRRLAGAREIEAAARSALATLLDPRSAPRLEALSRLLVSGGDLEPPPEALLVVPSGVLHALPFEVLPVGDAMLGDLAPTSYLPSASALLELPGERGSAPARLLALADPHYGSTRAAARSPVLESLRGLGSLPHTRAEARAVRSIFGSRSSRLLVGDAAVESRFKAERLGAYSVIHLATHGWIDPTSPARSGLLFGEEAGAEDGLLQFREILRLPLAADLVTLSACHTAAGELVTGEGMVGVTRAFFYAGARSVVASLWSVDDEASAELMRRFYRRLRRGDSKAEALRRARFELRGDPRFAHPYYWAPFVLVGRADDGVAMPADARPALAAALLALLALAAWRRRKRRDRAAPPAG